MHARIFLNYTILIKMQISHTNYSGFINILKNSKYFFTFIKCWTIHQLHYFKYICIQYLVSFHSLNSTSLELADILYIEQFQ